MSRSAFNQMDPITTETAKIAILIPCHNEEKTVREVVSAFRNELPSAEIYVFDNNSTDQTVKFALKAGAKVFHEARQGKGYVVQSMFRQVEADVYVMVDGDATYPAAEVHKLVAPVIADQADMVVGSRLHSQTESEFRHINRWGNRLVLALLNSIFHVRLTDILSGYRAFNRKFVKGLPLFGGGFEIETELTIKAVERGLRIVEIPTALSSRPEGSHSKIKLFRDGRIIVNTILALFRDYKPLTFFGSVGLALILVGLVPEIIAVVQIFNTGIVTHLSWTILGVGLSLIGMLLIVVGLILHTIVRRFQEIEHILQVGMEDRSRNLNA